MEQALCAYTLLIVITTFTFFFFNLKRRWIINNKWTSPPPPSPSKKLPIIGHLHLLTDLPYLTFTRLAQKLGPIFSLQLGRVYTIIISSPRLAQLVLKSNDHVFANRPQLLSAQYLSFGCSDVTFSRYGPYWRQARKIYITELLSPKRVNSFQLVRDEEVNRLLIAVSTQVGSEMDISKEVFGLANDILCRVAFGKRFIENKESGEGQKPHLDEVMAETQELLAGFCVGDFFPEWEWVNSVSGMKRRLMKNLGDLRVVCDEIIEEHLIKNKNENKDDEDGSSREDFVDVLLRVQQRDDLEVPITDDNIKALVLDMFVAGTDTTSATLEWTMTELARHPRVMKKAQAEVRQIASSYGRGVVVQEGHLQHLHYMKAVIKETMRLHPPVPLLVPRESMEECILDGYLIPEKTRVLINAYAIGRDPESWENPLEYNPERFVDNYNMDVKGNDFKFLPFGGGRRGCPGYSFGLATVETALAKLLCHFDWALPNGVGAEDVDLSEIFGLATRKKSALVLVPTVNKDYQFTGCDALENGYLRQQHPPCK